MRNGPNQATGSYLLLEASTVIRRERPSFAGGFSEGFIIVHLLWSLITRAQTFTVLDPSDAPVGLVLDAQPPQGNARQYAELIQMTFDEERIRKVDSIHPEARYSGLFGQIGRSSGELTGTES